MLERYRNYLRAIASRRLAGALRRRLDASDLVQETMVEAHRGIAGLLGADEPQRRAVLHKILRCNVANAIRDHLQAAKRRATLEQPLETAAGRPDSVATPSVQVSRQEQAARFLDALGQLPADQAEAVSMRYFEGCSVDEIAHALGRSRTAAAGLLKRGLEHLRRVIPSESGMWQ